MEPGEEVVPGSCMYTAGAGCAQVADILRNFACMHAAMARAEPEAGRSGGEQGALERWGKQGASARSAARHLRLNPSSNGLDGLLSVLAWQGGCPSDTHPRCDDRPFEARKTTAALYPASPWTTQRQTQRVHTAGFRHTAARHLPTWNALSVRGAHTAGSCSWLAAACVYDSALLLVYSCVHSFPTTSPGTSGQAHVTQTPRPPGSAGPASRRPGQAALAPRHHPPP
eukprot:352578-Chlamydomonas_euryale.AAC.5